MVLNHTSDQHPWFIDAARARDSACHDFYVWSDGRTDAAGRRLPPNNWVSLFGGSAWEYVPQLDQFYYHRYYRQQPDLNWRNPRVEREMFDVMRFWLDRGVAGFRLDAITALVEDAQLRDEPLLGGTNAQGDPILDHIYTDQSARDPRGDPATARHDRQPIPGSRVLIGETVLQRTADLDAWYGGARANELHLPMDTVVGLGNRLDAAIFRRHLMEAATELHDHQPLLVFDNHDNPRSWDRYGDGVHDAQIARIIATLLLTSRAAVLLYQGEEIGQRTATPQRVEDVRDPMGIRGWPEEKGRDGERTPMQWDASNAQAGFSTNPRTWLPVPPGYQQLNVQSELADPDSLLNWHRHLIAMRSSYAALRSGRMVMLDPDNADVLSYARVSPRRQRVRGVVEHVGARAVAAARSGGRRAGRQPRQDAVVESRRTSPMRMPAAAVSLPPYAAWVAAVRAQRVRRCPAACAGRRPPVKFAARHGTRRLATRRLSGWQTRHLHGGRCRARVRAARAAGAGARACYVLAHGAGAGMDHPFMSAAASHSREPRASRRCATSFPYMERGARRPDPPPVCHATVRAAVALAAQLAPGLPLFAGGRSFGGRMSSQAQALAPLPGVRGLVFLGFPLHPAGSPGETRAQHLERVQLPMLFVQGTRDALAERALRQRAGRAARRTRDLEFRGGCRSRLSRAGTQRPHGCRGAQRVAAHARRRGWGRCCEPPRTRALCRQAHLHAHARSRRRRRRPAGAARCCSSCRSMPRGGCTTTSGSSSTAC